MELCSMLSTLLVRFNRDVSLTVVHSFLLMCSIPWYDYMTTLLLTDFCVSKVLANFCILLF